MTQKPGIAVLVSGDGSNLQALIDSPSGIAQHIGLVCSNNPQAGALQHAENAGISTRVVDHREFADRQSYDARLSDVLDEFHPDLVVLAGYMRILTPGFVKHFQGRMLNIHPSLLPKYPGLNTHHKVLENGDTHHGATVHFVTEELDGGPAIIQGSLEVHGENEETLAQRVRLGIEHQIYPQAVLWFLQGRLHFSNNQAYLDGELIPAQGIQWQSGT